MHPIFIIFTMRKTHWYPQPMFLSIKYYYIDASCTFWWIIYARTFVNDSSELKVHISVYTISRNYFSSEDVKNIFLSVCYAWVWNSITANLYPRGWLRIIFTTKYGHRGSRIHSSQIILGFNENYGLWILMNDIHLKHF